MPRTPRLQGLTILIRDMKQNVRRPNTEAHRCIELAKSIANRAGRFAYDDYIARGGAARVCIEEIYKGRFEEIPAPPKKAAPKKAADAATGKKVSAKKTK